VFQVLEKALLKIHKPGNPAGRPIVASPYCHFFSCWLFLQHVQALPAYIRDTYHFLEIIRKLPPFHSDIFCTIDVTALYTNIPHTHGLAALEFFLNQRPKPHIPTGFP